MQVDLYKTAQDITSLAERRDGTSLARGRREGGVYSMSCMAVVACMTIDPRIPTEHVRFWGM